MSLYCYKCGSKVKVPTLWRMGIEIVFRCPECRTRFKTGFKMGALLSALSLTVALVVANLLIYLLSSAVLPLVALTIIPMWLVFAYYTRLWWIKRRYRKVKKRV